MTAIDYLTAQTWRNDAACALPEHRHLDWFPGRGESTAHLKAICNACPVRTACLDAAIDNGEHHGIWGGLSERQRRSVRSATHRRSNPETLVLDHLRRFGPHRGSIAQLAAAMAYEPVNTIANTVARLEVAGTVAVDPPAPRPSGTSVRSIAITAPEGTPPCA